MLQDNEESKGRLLLYYAVALNRLGKNMLLKLSRFTITILSVILMLPGVIVGFVGEALIYLADLYAYITWSIFFERNFSGFDEYRKSIKCERQ